MFYFLLAGIVVLNFLDGLTTYLGLFALPEGLRAEEANPLMSNMDTVAKFQRNMIVKAVAAFFIVALLYYSHTYDPVSGMFSAKVVNVAFLLVVIGNAAIYAGRKMKKRMTKTPIGALKLLLERAGLGRAAGPVSFYMYVAGVLAVSITSVTYLL